MDCLVSEFLFAVFGGNEDCVEFDSASKVLSNPGSLWHNWVVMNTVQIPLSEYQRLQEELELLKNTELLRNFNRLVDLLYQDKYSLFMSDYTEDLTETAVNEAWADEPSAWDNV